MSKPLFIYLLSDPRDGQPRYVGKTDRSIAERYKEHKSEISRLIHDDASNPTKVKWLHDLKTLGMEAMVEEIDYDDFENQIKEDFWICFYLNSGCELLNMVVPVDQNIPYPAPGANVPIRIKRTTVQIRSKDSHVYKESKFDQGRTEYLTKIYVLTDPLTLKEKFIGATDLDLDDEYNRLRSEMYSLNRIPVGEWWHSLFSEHDQRPNMRQIEQIKHSDAHSVIDYFMEYYALRGIDLEICSVYNSAGRIAMSRADKENSQESVLMRVIQRKKASGMTIRELSRTSAGRHPHGILMRMLDALKKDGKIFFHSIKTAGRPREVYVHSDFKEIAETE